jgi:hypothetical protein
MRVMLFEPFWTSPSFGPGHAALHSPTQKLSCFCSGASHGFGGAASGVACCAKLVDQFVEKLADKQISRTGRSRIMQSPYHLTARHWKRWQFITRHLLVAAGLLASAL